MDTLIKSEICNIYETLVVSSIFDSIKNFHNMKKSQLFSNENVLFLPVDIKWSKMPAKKPINENERYCSID